ncbi:MAG: flagellar export chaperone FliS [Phycisphaeraceae bacterium]|nr:flagellar export chaperone FliS [Phycisphaeraceae bacterium]
MTATKAQAESYLATKVLTASPAELRLMLLDGAIKFARQGRDALAAKDYEGMFKGFTRTREILVELSTTMRRDVGDPTLVERTQALYTFMMTRLLDASHDKDVAPADEVIKLIEYDRETWALLMDQLASEQRPGSDQPQPNAQAKSYTPFTAHG